MLTASTRFTGGMEMYKSSLSQNVPYRLIIRRSKKLVLIHP